MSHYRFAAAAVCLIAITGCTSFRENLLSPGVTPSREERAKLALRDFEDRRDAAQLAAALDRYNQGDTVRAEALLSTIVNRRPDYIDARLRLAEILWSRGDDSAEQHLRAILQTQPQHPDAHHTLGLLLHATGRLAEARDHASQAAQLEPQNEIFRATRDSLANASSS